MTMRLPVGTRNAIVDACVDRIDAGTGPGELRIYSGAQPASADDAVTGTLLATVVLGDPAFGNSANGTAAAADPAPVTGAAAGTAGWFRVVDSGGTGVFDGSIGAEGSGEDLELATTTISVGVSVDITSFTVSI